jgi:putative two-component system response regulator
MLALRRSECQLRDRAAWLAEEVRKATAQIVRLEHETIYRLSRAAECRDADTGAHIQRMAHYSMLTARGLGLGEIDQDLVLHAAPMHDIGKVGIPDHILLKPGELTPEETQIMRSHTLMGHRILADSDAPLLQAGALIALTHHERYDGSGYPQGLAGESIPIFGRITTVADVFDALASRRPYKGAWSFDEARAYLERHAGAHFDPACVHALLSSWSEVIDIAERYPDREEQVYSER